jgi:hypothetical protein
VYACVRKRDTETQIVCVCVCVCVAERVHEFKSVFVWYTYLATLDEAFPQSIVGPHLLIDERAQEVDHKIGKHWMSLQDQQHQPEE